MGRTKRVNFVEPVVAEPFSQTATEAAAEMVKKEGIAPLDLNLDLGRQDLNDAVGKIQDKLNELVKKANE